MNIFTRFLAQKHDKNPLLQNFITHWDELELLIIHIYRAKTTTPADSASYQRLQSWFKHNQAKWNPPLAPYWPPTLVGGQPAPQNPFLYILAIDDVAEFIDNWAVMQYLPAAREALNHLILTTESSS